MNYRIENKNLRVDISDFGAELQSIYGKTTKFEYLWQGNPEFWSGRAYNLFPICGRLYEGKYTYNGKEYKMGIHGFAKNMMFDVVNKEDNSIVFELKTNEQTLSIYPFWFCLRIKYTLIDAKLKQEIEIENKGIENLYFSFGVHYGFNIPLCDDAKFDEHYIDFIKEQNLIRELGSSNGLCSGVEVPYDLQENRYLPLSHKLFESNSIVLSNIGTDVTLKCNKTKRYINLSYKDVEHLVLWHTLNTEAPFLCIEPWHGIPSYDGIVDKLETKRDIINLQTNSEYETFIELTFNE